MTEPNTQGELTLLLGDSRCPKCGGKRKWKPCELCRGRGIGPRLWEPLPGPGGVMRVTVPDCTACDGTRGRLVCVKCERKAG